MRHDFRQPNDLFDFINVWFQEREITVRRESSHVILTIDKLPDNIAIATHLDPMAIGTFRALLRKAEYQRMSLSRS